MSNGLEDLSLFELFRMEAEEQVRVLQSELLALESGTSSAATLEALMRAAHSLKGAARIVGLDVMVNLTHAMEDRFVAAQNGRALTGADIDRMLAATDTLAGLQSVPEDQALEWLASHAAFLESSATAFSQLAPELIELPAEPSAEAPPPTNRPPEPRSLASKRDDTEDLFAAHNAPDANSRERTVRIASHRFDRILARASQVLVISHNIATRSDALNRTHHALAGTLNLFEDPDLTPTARTAALRELDRLVAQLGTALTDLDLNARSSESIAVSLHRHVLSGRLRPFSECLTGVARLVRDTARNLGKQVRLEVLGDRTRVDRDILERLEAPIAHLVSNAIDHGIESPRDRLAAGKTAEANLRIHARHENGRLVITVRDDGRGISMDGLRARAIARNLLTPLTAASLSDHELYEFLFLPGFSTRDEVSAISGRGVGLNVVQAMVQEAGGAVTVTSTPGEGTHFRLTLPVTRSVIKVIRVQVEGETYAVPLVRIDRVAECATTTRDDKTFIEHNGQELPVISLGNLLGLSTSPLPGGPLPLLLASGAAFAVDRFIDEIDLPVRRLDPRLGKIPGVSAASLDEAGLPLLILDVEDLVQTALGHTAPTPSAESTTAPHILVVDDSHTVREMERRILAKSGYIVTTAQNGQEAWNLLRLNAYDLLISDVDMPQMNGIELVTRLRDNPRLAQTPVIILSYKDREEDRNRGLEAGADFYLTKGDFQNNAFLQAVIDLVGTAEGTSEISLVETAPPSATPAP